MKKKELKLTYLWALYTGVYGSEGSLHYVFEYKQDAIEHIKKYENYKYIKHHDYYENDIDGLWFRIEKIEFYKRVLK